jgi:hypothetical protein
MKKIFTFLFLAVACISLSYAKKVDENTARIVGQQFLIGKAVPGQIRNITDVTLSYTSIVQNPAMGQSPDYTLCYYVFNINSMQGFVIVSGDDIVAPILGYSNQGSFDADHIPPHVAAWLKCYEDQIQYAINQKMTATPKITQEWELFKTTSNPKPLYKAPQGVAPLVQTKWNQAPYYNDLCPYDYQANDRAVTGCVATAMAQVLKYWNSPATGAGFHSYNDPRYGTQSADFGSTTYDWNSMPLSITSSNSAIATLMYHCGVSVDMTYGVAATGGSAAYVVSSQSPVTNCAEYALKTYFGYPATLHGEARATYSDATWTNMMKTDLDANRPLIYAGFGSGGGHCFVCDGYDDNGMFHFNWGWQGQFDGYFQINALNPEGVGTGGGTGGFNSGQQAIFGVQGSSGGGGTANLQIYAPMNISASPIYYGASFTVSTDIANMASSDSFSGDFCAAIFDANLAFVDFVELKTNMTLPAQSHYTNGITFSNPGLFTMLPGSYTIAVYYRTGGGNWILLPDGSGGNTNGIQVNVINPDAMEMYAPMTVLPGTTLTRGQQVSVHLDVANYGTTNFTGTWDVSLYNLDGSFAATIQSLSGYSLDVGYHYTNGLNFATSALVVTPGTYLMALQYLPDGGNWTLAGSTAYQNPIQVIVQEGTLTADMYESNNTIAQAYLLPFTFSGNPATANTSGSNCNTGTDYDFYKINLDPGYSYTIGAVVYDAGYTGGGSYSLDAIWGYTADGTTWSQTFDDVDPDNILMMNGGTLYFEVAPKFTGTTGTYKLLLNITKNPLGIDESGLNAFKVYPNPAKDYIYLVPANQQQWPSQVRISTADGRVVMNIVPGKQEDKLKIGVTDLKNDLYSLQMITPQGIITKQVIIMK